MSKEHPSNFYSAQTIPEFLREISANCSDQIAFTYKDEKLQKLVSKTYREFLDEVLRLTSIFLNFGLHQREVVAIYAKNSFMWFLTEIAAIFAG